MKYIAILSIAFLPISAIGGNCDGVNLSLQALKIVKPLLELRVKQSHDQFTDEGIWKGESPLTEKVDDLFYQILKNKTPEGDEALVYLLNVYMGEHQGEELVCEATDRGKKLIPLIKKYRTCAPKTGLEPIPKFVRGSDALPESAIEAINKGSNCAYE